jgi:hypothetical protein
MAQKAVSLCKTGFSLFLQRSLSSFSATTADEQAKARSTLDSHKIMSIRDKTGAQSSRLLTARERRSPVP